MVILRISSENRRPAFKSLSYLLPSINTWLWESLLMSLCLSFFINITSIIIISSSKNCGGNYNEVMDIKCSEQWALNKGSPLHPLPGAEITKYHTVSDLNNRNVSSRSSGIWKSKINVLVGSLPSDSLGRICPISVQLLVVCQKSLIFHSLQGMALLQYPPPSSHGALIVTSSHSLLSVQACLDHSFPVL